MNTLTEKSRTYNWGSWQVCVYCGELHIVGEHCPEPKQSIYENTNEARNAKITELEAALQSAVNRIDVERAEIKRLQESNYDEHVRAIKAEAVLCQIIKGVNDPQFTAADYFGGYDKLRDKLIDEWKEV